MSISAARNKRGRGRPPVGSIPINIRVPPDQVAALDNWIAAQPEPQPSRPDAVRQLIKLGIDASSRPAPASLDAQIAAQEKKIARDIPTERGPKKAMAVMLKGLAENDLRKLVAKKRPGGGTKA